VDVARRFAPWQRLGRLAHYRLLIPLRRSRHPPEYAARAVAIGLFWAFTPLIGIQMYLVLGTWLILRRFRNCDFHPLIGVAWTWVTNVFTMWPVYYVFYVTGKLFLGDWDAPLGYQAVIAELRNAFAIEDDLLHSLTAGFALLAKEHGGPMFLGCVPYAFGFAWLGYRWSLAYVRFRQQLRARRIFPRALGASRFGVIPSEKSPMSETSDNKE
jgi:hypothetical protein